jgi:SHS2 domain-containing protein
MNYRYLDNLATADAAFEAWGATLEDLFQAAADATLNVMVEDVETIALQERRDISLQHDSPDMLLFQILQEIIYYKDAEQLLLRLTEVRIDPSATGLLRLSAQARGERINPARHALGVDVKAVTLYRLAVVRSGSWWRATVVLDI